ncbi:MAG TPA: hypothetical protein VL241_05740 [Gemmatimonadales bacterium]|nr:hypothetical protein [Gemmatimonadales bacterium]
MQHGELIGIGAQGVRQAILGADFGSQHGPGVDAAHLGAEQPSPAPEDRAQRALPDDRHLADPLELILVQPDPDVVGNSGQQVHRMRRQKGGFAAGGHQQGRHPLCINPPDPGSRFGYQLVHRDPHHQRQAQAVPRFPPDALGDVERGTEESLGAAQVEKGVAIPARLDHRRVHPQDLAERPGGARIEPGIGWQQHQVGAELARPAHQHAACNAGGLGFGRERQHRGAIRARGSHRERTAAQRRRHQLLDGGAEGRGIDEEDGLQRPIALLGGKPNASFRVRSLRPSARS